MADLMSNALSSLVAHQRALATTSHNIANVDTEGYSRQQVDFASRTPQTIGSLTIGSGVDVAGIRRMYDEFSVAQIRSASTASSQFETQYQLATELDNTLADSELGLSASLSQFFNSLQDVANEPASVSARQLFLSEAETLAYRFNDLSDRLDALQTEISGRVDDSVFEINDLVNQIANINANIGQTSGSSVGVSNDLLDQRDQAILKLSELVNISTAVQDDGSVNVFVGRGDALVIGATANTLSTVNNASEPDKRDVVLSGGSVITGDLTGGSLGGALAFQRDTLTSARNELGRIAVAVADVVNQQNNAGLDLYGERGQDIFSVSGPVVAASPGNTGNAVMSAILEDLSTLTGDNLQIRYDGIGWQIVNQQTGAAVSNVTGSGTSTDPLMVQGLAISFTGTAQAGDQFTIRPTSEGASSFTRVMTAPNRVAAAAATRSAASATNTGNAAITETTIVDGSHPNLTDAVTISFTDANTYQINGVGSYPYTAGEAILINGNEVSITGIPSAGDSFSIGLNTGASGDNRNALAIAELEAVGLFAGGSTSIGDAIGGLTGKIAVYTRSVEVNMEAQQNLKTLAEERQQSVAGVNLDEEAANLIKYQQAYSAAAQAISTANELFQSLIGALR
jgi:flagellar hook-associated protein 1